MSDCHDTLLALSGLASGALPSEEAARVRQHLEGCPGCRAAAASELALHERLVRATSDEDGAAAVPRLLAQARARAAAQARPRFGQWRRVLAAAALLLAVGMGLMVALGPPCLRGQCPTMHLLMDAYALSDAPTEPPAAHGDVPAVPGLVPVGAGQLTSRSGSLPVTFFARDGTRLIVFRDPGAHTHFWQVERLADGRDYVDRQTPDGQRMIGWVDGTQVWCCVGADAERTFALARELRQRVS